MYGIHNEGRPAAAFKKWERCSERENSSENWDAAAHRGRVLTMLYRTTGALQFSVFLTNFIKGQTLFVLLGKNSLEKNR